MDAHSILSDIKAFLTKLSHDFGTGDLQSDIALGCIVVTVFVVIFSLLMILRNTSVARKVSEDVDPLRGLTGRVEKLEITLNTMKTEVLRAQALLKADMEYIKIDTSEIKDILNVTHSNTKPKE